METTRNLRKASKNAEEAAEYLAAELPATVDRIEQMAAMVTVSIVAITILVGIVIIAQTVNNTK
jgi:hypothetical protein